MTRTLTAVALVACWLNQGHGQSLAKTPAFEVASITPCKPGTPEPPMEHTGMAEFTFPGGRFTARATTLKFLLEWAYGIQPSQHSGGPSWIGVDRYDIMAKADGNATDAQMRLMVQTRYSLAQLADAFARQLGSVIVNNTGLDGEFDFALDLTPDDSRPNPMDPTLLIGAMREQLGLTLNFQKQAVDFLVIDGAEKVEAGN
jgi:hypothetical protein